MRLFCSQASPKNLVVCILLYPSISFFQTVKTLEEYEALKVSKADLMVGWFYAPWSTAAKIFEGDFDKLASQYPNV